MFLFLEKAVSKVFFLVSYLLVKLYFQKLFFHIELIIFRYICLLLIPFCYSSDDIATLLKSIKAVQVIRTLG
jgi:hypothetical protein